MGTTTKQSNRRTSARQHAQRAAARVHFSLSPVVLRFLRGEMAPEDFEYAYGLPAGASWRFAYWYVARLAFGPRLSLDDLADAWLAAGAPDSHDGGNKFVRRVLAERVRAAHTPVSGLPVETAHAGRLLAVSGPDHALEAAELAREARRRYRQVLKAAQRRDAQLFVAVRRQLARAPGDTLADAYREVAQRYRVTVARVKSARSRVARIAMALAG